METKRRNRNPLRLKIGDEIKWKSKHWSITPIRGIGVFNGFADNGKVIVRYNTGAPFYKSRPIQIDYEQITDVLKRVKKSGNRNAAQGRG